MYFSELILIHKSSLVETNDETTTEQIDILDYGQVPSLRLLTYDEELLKFITPDSPKIPVCYMDQNIFNFNAQILSDHDIYYLMKSVKDIKSIGSLKILPYGYYDHRWFNSNKLKIIPLPLKDIGYHELPLSYKIMQIIQSIKRDKLKQITSFNNNKNKDKQTLKIDILFDNDELSDTFMNQETIKNDIYDFPHYIGLFNKSNYTFINIKKHIKQALLELNINNNSNKGIILLLTENYIFITPVVRPYHNFKNEIGLFADPLFYAGVFSLPQIDSEWDETIILELKSIQKTPIT